VNCLAWLDTVVEARGAGFLCREHAERVTPPRGWSMLDRRSPEPMLFVQRHVEADPLGAGPLGAGAGAPDGRTRPRRPKRSRAARPRHDTGDGNGNGNGNEAPVPAERSPGERAEPELPFAAAPTTTPAAPRSWSVRDLPALDEEFDVRTPLLAKAFESLRQSQTERRPAPGDPESGPPSAARSV
jgi:hypothetical protein